ncbi:MAG TPA: cytochrome c [Gammaproteobacteria bacterium]
MRNVAPVLVVAAALAACAAEPPAPAPPSGAMTFATHCASCHGPQGEGDGPVAATMAVAVPNLRALTERNDGVFPAEAIASYIDGRALPAAHGTRLMPVWGDVFSATQRLVVDAADPEQRIAAVVDFLREIQR